MPASAMASFITVATSCVVTSVRPCSLACLAACSKAMLRTETPRLLSILLASLAMSISRLVIRLLLFRTLHESLSARLGRKMILGAHHNSWNRDLHSPCGHQGNPWRAGMLPAVTFCGNSLAAPATGFNLLYLHSHEWG